MKPIPNLISIVFPVHQAESSLQHTLDSLKAQTLRDYEILLIDDASTDGTLSLAQSFAARDPRIHIIALPHERGIEAARSVGLDAARGQYLAFINTDETWDTTKLAKQREFMIQGNHGVTCLAYRTTKGRIHQIPSTITPREVILDNLIRLSTVMIDRHLTGDFRLTPIKDHDLILWESLMRQGIAPIGIPEVLATCVHPNGSTSGFHTLKRRWTIARSIFRLSTFQTIKLLAHTLY